MISSLRSSWRFGRAETYLEHADGMTKTPGSKAGTAIASGEWDRGADIVDSTGAIADAAEIRLSAAETLITGGRRAEGEEHLRRSLEFYRSVRRERLSPARRGAARPDG